MPNNIFIKGCPLCGYPAIVQTRRDPDMRKLINPNLIKLKGEQVAYKPFYYVVCTHCKIRTAMFTTSVDAITAWNQRVDADKKKRTAKFPKGPWKYYTSPDSSASYSIANTTPKLETLQHLCDVCPDHSLSPYVIESMMRLITAGPAMYARLAKATELLDLVISHLDQEYSSPSNLDDDSQLPPVKFDTGMLKGLQSDIKLLLAGIDGASVTFNPETDTPKTSKDQLAVSDYQPIMPRLAGQYKQLRPINQRAEALRLSEEAQSQQESTINEGNG